MTTVSDTIVNYFPADGDVSVPLKSTIWILFDRALDEDELNDNFFVEGPDTDQFVGLDFTLQEYPDNISQGDDFLTSPGYKGIMQGTLTFQKIDMTDATLEVEEAPYRTKLIFTPSHVMAALTEYKAVLPQVTDSEGTLIEGAVTFSWTTGSGSIEALPSSGSTSVLGLSSSEAGDILSVTKTYPTNHQVEIDPELEQIIITFDKPLEESTVTLDKFIITSQPATDHPSITVNYTEELVKSVEVDSNKVIITI